MGLRRAGWYAAGMDPKEIAARIDAMHEGTFAGELGLVMVSASRDEVRAFKELFTPQVAVPAGQWGYPTLTLTGSRWIS